MTPEQLERECAAMLKAIEAWLDTQIQDLTEDRAGITVRVLCTVISRAVAATARDVEDMHNALNSIDRFIRDETPAWYNRFALQRIERLLRPPSKG